MNRGLRRSAPCNAQWWRGTVKIQREITLETEAAYFANAPAKPLHNVKLRAVRACEY